MLALMVSDITNPFYCEIIRGARGGRRRGGLHRAARGRRRSPAGVERQALERTLPVVEGIVLGSSRMSDSAIRMIAKQKPMVVLNRDVADVPSVVTDNARGMRRAVEHLAALGHERITYVAGPEASLGGRRAMAGAARGGLELEPDGRAGSGRSHRPSTAACRPPRAGGRSRPYRGHRLQRPDRDRRGARAGAAGLRVPRDVSVVGFDDILAARLVTPALTTVAAPLHAMGARAVGNLLAFLRGAAASTDQAFEMPTRLVGARRRGVDTTGSVGLHPDGREDRVDDPVGVDPAGVEDKVVPVGQPRVPAVENLRHLGTDVILAFLAFGGLLR